MKQNYRMIDVGAKNISRRRAIARGAIRLGAETMQMIRQGNSPKGNILAIAEVAGIMAAKNTSNLLPLCHQLGLDSVKIWFDIGEHQVHAHCEVICSAKTGVEMEALVGVNVCLLTMYDLAKAIDPVIEISDIYLEKKEGGKSGVWTHPKATVVEHENGLIVPTFQGVRYAIGTLSDRASQGIYQDESGTLLRDYCRERSGAESIYRIIPDDEEALRNLIIDSTEQCVDLVLLTGGTGVSNRDITPDTIQKMASKELVGFGELQRYFGSKQTKLAWLSRVSAYVVQDMLVVLFPGSPKAVRQGLDAIGELIPHALKMLRGGTHHENAKGESL